MPGNTAQTPIIDLTDIVEQKSSSSAPHRPAEEKISGQVSDLMKSDDSAGSDLELDDLLAQLNDEEGDPATPPTPVVNPNERLTMPGMDDMDAMLGQFGSAPNTGDAGQSGGATSSDPELDDLLADLDGPPAKSPASAKAPADDDLDALLADLDGPPAKAPAQAAGSTKNFEDDLDALLDSKPESGQAVMNTTADQDDLLANLGITAPASGASSAASSGAGNKADEMLNNLLEGLDVPPSGPMDRPVAPAGIDTRHIDALLDDVVGSAKTSNAGDGSAMVEAGLVLELRESLESLRERVEHTANDVLETREDQEQLRQSIEALQSASGDISVDDSGAALDDLTTRLDTVSTEQEQLRQSFEALQSAGTASADATADLVRTLTARLDTVSAEQEQLRQSLEALQSAAAAPAATPDATADTAADATAETLARLTAVEEHCTGFTQDLAALRERMAELEAGLAANAAAQVQAPVQAPAQAEISPEQLDGIVAHVLSAMRGEIEKAAAASAAKIIREEISALFAASS